MKSVVYSFDISNELWWELVGHHSDGWVVSYTHWCNRVGGAGESSSGACDFSKNVTSQNEFEKGKLLKTNILKACKLSAKPNLLNHIQKNYWHVLTQFTFIRNNRIPNTKDIPTILCKQTFHFQSTISKYLWLTFKFWTIYYTTNKRWCGKLHVFYFSALWINNIMYRTKIMKNQYGTACVSKD